MFFFFLIRRYSVSQQRYLDKIRIKISNKESAIDKKHWSQISEAFSKHARSKSSGGHQSGVPVTLRRLFRTLVIDGTTARML